jgi:hypothetical protein
MGPSIERIDVNHPPALEVNKAHRKHESHMTADYYLSTAECHEQASALYKEATLTRLFLQCKPNSYTFDIGLGSNTQYRPCVHDASIYLSRDITGILHVEYLSSSLCCLYIV